MDKYSAWKVLLHRLNINMIYQKNTVKIATLNCRGLKKTYNHPQRKKQFIRYLQTLGCKTLVLQATHARDNITFIIGILNTQLNCKSSLWTQHCGTISLLTTNYTLKLISEGIDGGRFILASLHLITRDLRNSPTTPRWWTTDLPGRISSCAKPYPTDSFYGFISDQGQGCHSDSF